MDKKKGGRSQVIIAEIHASLKYGELGLSTTSKTKTPETEIIFTAKSNVCSLSPSKEQLICLDCEGTNSPNQIHRLVWLNEVQLASSEAQKTYHTEPDKLSSPTSSNYPPHLHTPVKLVSWNIAGWKASLHEEDFPGLLSEYDAIVPQETWLTEKDRIVLPGYLLWQEPARKVK